MKFIITVDTEADNQWGSNGATRLENIKMIPRFQDLCNRYGFPPTYLITYEVAASADGVRILRPLQDSGRAEVGAHLHPWTTPPYFNETEEKRLMHFPSELSNEYLREKFVTLHEMITERFSRPMSFRAGRWGYDERVDALLKEFGYLADCSVTPYTDWNKIVRKEKARTLPSFLNDNPAPYCTPSGIVEMPMTIVPKDTEWISRLVARLLCKGSFRVRWCRIFPETTSDDLIAVAEFVKSQNLPYLEFMAHSSEFLVGGSPYSKTHAQVEHFFTLFENFLQYLKKNGVIGITLTSAARESENSVCGK